MNDRFNTIAGWVLFAGIVALGSSVASYKYFHADKPERPDQLGYIIEGVEEELDSVVVDVSIAEALNMMSADEQIAAGQRVFAKCSACHTIEQGGANGIGPNLYAVMGLPIARSVAGYQYSDALNSLGGNWTWEAMDLWLKNPRSFADGTKMSFAGLKKIEDRAAVSMYMNSYGSALPIPDVEMPDGEEPQT